MRAFYRARQLLTHLRTKQPCPPPEWLTPAERSLFLNMAPPDQHEGLAVAKTLQAWGYGSDRELIIAGLLHDAGKAGAAPGARYRVTVTALETLTPGLLRWLAARSSTLDILLNHAERGAEMARQAGLSPRVVQLIAAHHSGQGEPRLQVLRRADALH